MPDPKTLSVRQRGTAMVPDYEHQGSIRRFHGWKHDPKLGVEFKHPETGRQTMSGGFANHDETIVVPNTVEYRRHLRDKDLWPADQATAQEAGVPFDPNFGESTVTAVSNSAQALHASEEH
jgi:hypothetical protein